MHSSTARQKGSTVHGIQRTHPQGHLAFLASQDIETELGVFCLFPARQVAWRWNHHFSHLRNTGGLTFTDH